MELIETVKNRRSIRKFENKDVDNKIIEDLIEYARLAPSAKNRQPWKFVVVKDKIKNQIADIMLEQQKSLKVDLEKKYITQIVV